MPQTLPARRFSTRLRAPMARIACAISLCALAPLPVAHANNWGESASWQFNGPQDLAAQAAARDLIERRRGGVFAAPIYNTNIARQYNCSVSATAIGNNGTQSALANSPTTTGATSSATGNNSSSQVTGDGSDATIGNGQSNAGTVGAGIDGATTTNVAGAAWQSLNSTQSNSGNQSASVMGTNACAFGVLN